MMAEQPLNARMVEEEIKVVPTCNGSVKGLAKVVRELMEGERGKQARNKVQQLAAVANKAVQEGGSSYKAMDSLNHQICNWHCS
ncbi:hypothetical protein L6164_005143 [Bauhinia variegata]|uniref:Uncharacterized protein n=1 Tax=Bauhinia variegata TaxID=167791 RepID=A0ACB9PPI0_BAUVA|nr:hypothetical protein L6164_005143 [Bauhinia variegata]